VKFKEFLALAAKEDIKWDAEVVAITNTCCGYDDCFEFSEDSIDFDNDYIRFNLTIGSCRESGHKKACKNLRVTNKILEALIDDQNINELLLSSDTEVREYVVEYKRRVDKKRELEVKRDSK
jgi:hypothetical protein